MQEDLMSFWGIGVAVFSFLLGINIKEAFEKNLTNPNRVTGLSDLLVLLALFAWFMLYLYSTWFETKGMAIVFSDARLHSLGVHVSFLLMALSLAVFFAIIISYHNKIIVVCVMALLLGLVDTYGNYNLMSGMMILAAQDSADNSPTICAEVIWQSYYLTNPQLPRVLTYMAIVFVALMLCVYREKLKAHMNPTLLENLPKFVVVAAILANELTMLSWRVDRENALEKVNKSYYFQWSPNNVITDVEVSTKQDQDCPVSLSMRRSNSNPGGI